jgi:DNA polymerase-3 subunit alpha
MLALANRIASDAAEGTSDLFGGTGGSEAKLDVRPLKPWNAIERLQHEFDAVGFFLSGHPLDAYASALRKLGTVSYAELEARADRGVVAGRLAGVVVSARERRSQKGNKFAFAMFSEPTGQFEAIIFSETLAQSRHLLEAGTAVILNVEGERGEGDTLKLRAQSIESLDAAAENIQNGVKVMLDGRVLNGARGAIDDLRQLLRPGGKSTVCFGIALSDAGRELEIALPGRFEVSPAQKSALQTVPGVLEIIDL